MFVSSISLCVFVSFVFGLDDLTPAALTVYRNPAFFRHLSHEFNNHLDHFANRPPHNHGSHDEHQSPSENDAFDFSQDHNYHENHNLENQSENKHTEEEDSPRQYHNKNHEEDEEEDPQRPYSENTENDDDDEDVSSNYDEEQSDEEPKSLKKYPGEPSNPNPPGPPKVNVHFDGGSDFRPPPRDIRPSPNKPPKRGRRPYGHPQFNQNQLKKGYDPKGLPNSGRQQRNHPIKESKQPLQQLQIFHEGKRYPLDAEETRGHEEIPLRFDDHFVDHEHHYQSLPPIHYHYNLNGVKEEKNPFIEQEELRESKKGTREYLKHNSLPSINDEPKGIQGKQQKHYAKINYEPKYKSKPTRKYVAYRVRPYFAQYRVVPVKYRPVYYTHKAPYYKRSTTRRKPNIVADDSAYVINSHLDQDYQKLRGIRRA